MAPTPSRDINDKRRKDRDREQTDAIVKDADENEQAERDNVHGDGKEIGLEADTPSKPKE